MLNLYKQPRTVPACVRVSKYSSVHISVIDIVLVM